MVNERSEVASAVMANVFWLNDNDRGRARGRLALGTGEFVFLKYRECREVEGQRSMS